MLGKFKAVISLFDLFITFRVLSDVLACLLLTAELMLSVPLTLCRDSPIDLEEASELPENLNDDLVNSLH